MKNNKNRLAIFLAAGLAAGLANGAMLDGVAAKVDSQVITVGDVMNEIRRHPGTRSSFANAKDENEAQALYREAVRALVDRKLVLKAAEGKKLEIPEWVIDNRIREIVLDMFGGDMNRLDEELEKTKLPMSEYRATIRDDLVVQAMRQQIVEKYVVATPSEMKREFETHPERYRNEEKTSVRVILLKPGDASDGTPSMTTRWEQIGEEMAMGKSFAEMAIKYSADSHATEGGLWKDIQPEKVFRPEIVEALGKMRVGKVSKLINLDGWGFVVKKESHEDERSMTFEEAYDKVQWNIRNEKAKRAYDEWVERLKDDAFVKIYPAPEER